MFGMIVHDHLQRFSYPCRHCGYDVRAQNFAGILRCSECGVELPDLVDHANPILAWPIVTGRRPEFDPLEV